MSFGIPEPSSHIRWPTKENPFVTHKFTSIWLEQGLKQFITERSTYSMLEWVGDVGGLYDGLIVSAQTLLSPLALYALKEMLASSILGQSSRREAVASEKNKAKHEGRDSQESSDETKYRSRRSLCRTMKQRRHQKAFLSKVNAWTVKQFDLVKFLKMQRMTFLTSMTTLNAAQRRKIEQLSTVNKHEI